ncbi:Release factor glutamine methyltransferase [Acholeplasma oculi]|uniref:peptide chain release factor N(5)-glutamine methyltransferase n=1 Tax=Acholeplasma oculi TaxID=35623 RepID=A0A061ABY8_9MOLU|nr:peptide chain release factor N(5)-glutamine methyltransferase [Acholeplasma oculi]CDR31338.1 Protein-(glutamine-N5) methyltransferase PrmC [Acholeplasma oculi]SKC39151.1 release factor glutamine methyltransferase [Acholeplasma oculi]SUT91681.1 Release factor glutamine methyltransferase [Acholeplasma oculi]
MKLQELLKKYEKLAHKYQLDEHAVSWMIMELSEMQASEFYLNMNQEVSLSLEKKIEDAFNQYHQEEIPVQHILGFSYFYGYKYIVNNQVLIPRRETEELVEEVLMIYDTYFNDQNVDILDLGTGSGNISVTLSLETKDASVDATDISEEALEVARKNNQVLGGNVEFFISDWFSNVQKTYDIIVANPPYIPQNEAVERTVLNEPHIALFGGTDGLKPYEIVLSQAKNYMKDKALIAFEHSMYQSENIKALVEKYFTDAVIIQKKDLQQRDRMTFVGIGGVLK